MSPNPSYERGRRFEYKVKQELESKGYLCFRTAGSHGIADIIAVKRIHNTESSYGYTTTYLVQCKYGTANLSRDDIVKLTRLADRYGCVPVLARGKPNKSTVYIDLYTTGTLNM